MRKDIIVLLLITGCFTACQKNFLDKKPDKALLVPTKLVDFQALFDNDQVFNLNPALSVMASDDYYITDKGFNSLTVIEKNNYLWMPDIYQGEIYVGEWLIPYKQVFYTNVVLEGLSKIKPDASTQDEWNRIKGSALFYRAFAFYNLASLFAAPFYSETAKDRSGIILHLNSDVNQRPGRSTIQQTYDQIIADINEAESLLSSSTLFKSRPTKVAAQALLARVYLSMENYDLAYSNADKALKSFNALIDFNTLNPNAARPMPQILPNGNQEVIFYAAALSYSFLTGVQTGVDSILVSSYQNNDLRKKVFFKDRGANLHTFKGNYTGNIKLFGGLATDELYLIRAECNARAGNTEDAIKDLNTLLITRWKKDTFVPFIAVNKDDALKLIISERRKSLLTRGLRWTDLRRLNRDKRFAVTISRKINDKQYSLSPDDQRYLLPIPGNEIKNDVIQNNR